jgi:hypothetical protein
MLATRRLLVKLCAIPLLCRPTNRPTANRQPPTAHLHVQLVQHPQRLGVVPRLGVHVQQRVERHQVGRAALGQHLVVDVEGQIELVALQADVEEGAAAGGLGGGVVVGRGKGRWYALGLRLSDR